jgi:antitoxin component YwqK of YwqJK toxin-antitoxin module
MNNKRKMKKKKNFRQGHLRQRIKTIYSKGKVKGQMCLIDKPWFHRRI